MIIFGNKDMGDVRFPEPGSRIWKKVVEDHVAARAVRQMRMPDFGLLLERLDLWLIRFFGSFKNRKKSNSSKKTATAPKPSKLTQKECERKKQTRGVDRRLESVSSKKPKR